MSLDKEAITLLQQSETLKNLSSEIHDKKTLVPLVAVPDGFSVTSLERYMSFRVRFRGKMHTSVIPSFVDYVKNESFQAGSHCFLDAEKMQAINIFNFGGGADAGHCDYSAVLQLEKTAEYKALLNFDGAKLDQKDFAEFLEDWADYITCENENGDTMSLARAISAVRRITVQASVKADSEQRNFSSEKSALESISINAENALPSKLFFECSPYLGLESHNFALRVSALTSRDKPMLVARIVRHEQAQQKFAKDFCSMLVELFEQSEINAPVTIGQFSLGS